MGFFYCVENKQDLDLQFLRFILMLFKQMI